MTTITKERARVAQIDKGEWLSKLLDDVRTDESYAPTPIAVMRMRTRIHEGMVEQVQQAA
jgi:hypothetical protein